MKSVLITVLFIVSAMAKSSLLDCNQVFEQRKDELARELDRVDKRQQEFEAYQEASMELMDKKKRKLREKIDELNATLTKVEATKKEVIKLYEDNKKTLDDIQTSKDNKISATYLKMKEKKAAAILDNMPREKAAKILSMLTPKKISKIMEKMNPIYASEVTLILKEGMQKDGNFTK
jgi:flagellar motility protein MotE (MotC chaperone)